MSGHQEDTGTLDLSERLRAIMTAHKLTVAEFAEAAGVSKSAMEKYLAGPSSPRATAIASLCRRLGISADWLLFDYSKRDFWYEVRMSGIHVIETLLRDIKQDGELREKVLSADMAATAGWMFIRELADTRAIELAKFVLESDTKTLKAAFAGEQSVQLAPVPLFSDPLEAQKRHQDAKQTP